MANDSARILGEELAGTVIGRMKEHFTWATDLLPTRPPSRSNTPDSQVGGGDSVDLIDELQFLSAFIAAYVVGVAFASNTRYKSDVVRELRAYYLELQDHENRALYSALLDDRFARYEAVLSTRRPGERDEDALATAFADLCGDVGYDFCSIAADLIAGELIVMRGVVRQV